MSTSGRVGREGWPIHGGTVLSPEKEETTVPAEWGMPGLEGEACHRQNVDGGAGPGAGGGGIQGVQSFLSAG